MFKFVPDEFVDHSGISPIIIDHSFAMHCIAVQQISFATSLQLTFFWALLRNLRYLLKLLAAYRCNKIMLQFRQACFNWQRTRYAIVSSPFFCSIFLSFLLNILKFPVFRLPISIGMEGGFSRHFRCPCNLSLELK